MVRSFPKKFSFCRYCASISPVYSRSLLENQTQLHIFLRFSLFFPMFFQLLPPNSQASPSDSPRRKTGALRCDLVRGGQRSGGWHHRRLGRRLGRWSGEERDFFLFFFCGGAGDLFFFFFFFLGGAGGRRVVIFFVSGSFILGYFCFIYGDFGWFKLSN